MVYVPPVSERDLEELNVELITMRARETTGPGLHIHKALKYNLLMLCLNTVKVCMCVSDSGFFVKCNYLKYTTVFVHYFVLSAFF